MNAFLLRRELSGFKRRERLDVKKPGPLFPTNNHIFKMQTPITEKDSIVQTTTEQEDDNVSLNLQICLTYCDIVYLTSRTMYQFRYL